MAKKVALPKETRTMTRKELRVYALSLLKQSQALAAGALLLEQRRVSDVIALTEKLKHPTYEVQKAEMLHELASLVNAVGHAVRTAMWSTRDIGVENRFGR